jgi:hypothetical protein
MYFDYPLPGIKLDTFELVNVDDGTIKKVKLSGYGYFAEKAGPGNFVFRLNMRQKGYTKSTRDSGFINLAEFEVPRRSIFNIGTYTVEVDKHKAENAMQFKFKVVPLNTKESFLDPHYWFKNKYPELMANFRDRIDILDRDGSKIKYEGI